VSAPLVTSGGTPALRPGGRRPNPRIAQLKRTWYFLSRNTLAMVGLGIIVFFVCVAAYSFFYPAPSDHLQLYCGTYAGPGGAPVTISGACIQVCTYPTGSPPPAPNCYPTDVNNPAIVPPTLNLATFQSGPLPFGSLEVANNQYFYNIFAGLVKGAPWSLGIASGIVLSGAAIGLLLGSVAGYFGGLVDEVIMRITDVFLSIPGLLLVLVLLAVLGSSIPSLQGRVLVLMGAFVVTFWPIYTRIVRGQVLVTREQKYVEASRASGARSGRILTRHIVPNSVFPVFVQLSLDVGSIPLGLGAIVFLGYHIFPTPYFPEWGSISANAVAQVQGLITTCQAATAAGSSCIFPWWQLFFPGVTLFMFAISVNFLSDGLRDALDPRLRR
jgi:peptide/nickel transport system permease protein